MARKVYSREFKQSAVSLLTEQQYKPKEAARNLGVNLFTLKSWLNAQRQNGGVVDAAEQADLRKQLRRASEAECPAYGKPNDF